jgi:hypothetical protein
MFFSSFCFSYGDLEVSSGGTQYPMLSWDSGVYNLQVKLPDSLTCDQCIFQVSSSSYLLNSLELSSTVKLLYNDHPWDPKKVAVVDRWSLFSGHLCSKSLKWDLKIVGVTDRWSLFGGDR